MQAVAPRLKVVVVGDGPERAALQVAHRDFVFAGMRSGAALAEHYASADVFVFPSLTETFGNVTAEAMASRLAVVAFDYAAARQCLRHRASALLAPYGDAGAFVEAAQAVVADDDLRERLREAAAEAARGLSWARVIDDLEAVLAGLAARSRAGRVVAAGAGAAPPTGIAGTDRASP
jgi:glycosyltransferase involved in cell wall biosynthesis